MPEFAIASDFQMTGDQPHAVERLTRGLLDGVTQLLVDAGVIAHNKTLAAQLATEFKEFFPNNAVEYFVSYYDYYQPEAYVPQTDTYVEKDASINEELDKLRLSATTSLLTRRDVLIVASVSCIYGLGDQGLVVGSLTVSPSKR